MGLIYMAVNIHTDAAYIGQTTTSLNVRNKQHYTKAKRDQKYNRRLSYFHKALLKYTMWDWIILEDNIETKKLLNEAESFYIAYYKGIGVELYNLTKGGDGWSKNMQHTQETKELMRESHIGIPHSSERKYNIGKGNAKLRVFMSPEGERVEVPNVREFCRIHGFTQANINYMALGKQSHAYGWRLWSI